MRIFCSIGDVDPINENLDMCSQIKHIKFNNSIILNSANSKQVLNQQSIDDFSESYTSYLATLIYENQVKNQYRSEVKSCKLRNNICENADAINISNIATNNIFILKKKSKYNALLAIIFAFFNICFFPVYSQQAKEILISPLKIGDSIPSKLWDLPLKITNDASGKEVFRLNEFKSKELIIIDFWATWCSGCIQSFPKIKALGEKFSDDILVINATKQNKSVVDDFFASKAGRQYAYLPSITDAQLLEEYFPHKLIPFLVWIYKGRLYSFTDAGSLNEDNILKTLTGGESKMPIFHHIEREKFPLLISPNIDSNLKIRNYSIFIEGSVRGVNSSSNIRRINNNGIEYGRQFTNLPMNSIYFGVVSELFRRRGTKLFNKKIITQVNHPERLANILLADGTFALDNLYSYELNVPISEANSLYEYMLADLNRYSNYIASIENKKMNCLVITGVNDNSKIKTSGSEPSIRNKSHSYSLINYPISQLVNHLNQLPSIQHIIIDESNYGNSIDIEIFTKRDLNEVLNQFKKFGINYEFQDRDIDVLVIRDKIN